MKEFLQAIGILVLIPITAILDGWAISTNWRWFVAQTFDIPTLSLVQAIGLGLIVRHITYRYTAEDKREFSTQLFTALLLPITYVGLGWFVTLFL